MRIETKGSGLPRRGMSRYLTESEKAKELAEWQNAIVFARPGPGSPDSEIISWCEMINRIPGVCTVQSCSGHEQGERGPWSLGHLWLRLNEPKASAFYKRAFELAERNGIDRVSLIYQPWGEEIVQIEFHGLPHSQLENSLVQLIDFLKSLALIIPTGSSLLLSRE